MIRLDVTGFQAKPAPPIAAVSAFVVIWIELPSIKRPVFTPSPSIVIVLKNPVLALIVDVVMVLPPPPPPPPPP
jgi:hypothetical protein